MREMMKQPRMWIEALAAVLVGLAFGVMAPFGTQAGSGTAGRYAYWLLAIGLNWAQMSIALFLVRRSALAQGWGALRVGLCVAGGVSLPASFEIIWLDHYFFGMTINSVSGLAEIYLYVFLVSVLITVPAQLIQTAKPQPLPAPPAAAPTFFDRIPPALGHGLIGLEMEDHYLRIHTDRGSDLILCRFGDALRELAGFDGLQVHRSWYVARSAIRATRKDGQKMVVTLSNGMDVPVSRNFQKTLRDAG
jgi:uncharacterized membrane protein